MEASKRIIGEIKETGIVSQDILQTFFYGKDFSYVRNWLEENGIDRHTTMELYTSDVALITPKGIIMQVRSNERGKLGLWGGVLNFNEHPRDGAIRELFEETGLRVRPDALIYASINPHFHTYSNGDKCKYTTYMFKLFIDYIPDIILNDESIGFELIKSIDPRIFEFERDFISMCLQDIE